MSSLFSKARVFVLGNLHELMDAAIDLNSVASVKQYIRDLESARDGIRIQAATATGRVTTLTANIANLQKEIDENTSNIDLLLGDDDPSNDSNAVTIQLTVDNLKSRLESNQTDLATAQQMANSMNDAVQKIVTKHGQMASQLRTLEQQAASADANEQAANAMEAVASLSNIDSSSTIDNVSERIQARAATAKARLDQAFGSVSSGADDSVALAKAKKAIEDRKAALGKTAPVATAAAA
jgi:phage shock protein A